MQVLNKGCIIKAVHSTCCTIEVLGRGMDYSDNERGEHGRDGGLQHNQLLTEKESMEENDDTGCSAFLISMHFLRISKWGSDCIKPQHHPEVHIQKGFHTTLSFSHMHLWPSKHNCLVSFLALKINTRKKDLCTRCPVSRCNLSNDNQVKDI